MDNQSINQLLACIKDDDVKTFDALATGRLFCVTLGRFPLLSLCYMYKSYLILGKYENRMKETKIENYVKDDEPLDIYFDFKKIAGKSLRFYPSSSTVTPLEMLCLLGKDKKMTAEWQEFDKNSTTIENIKKIGRVCFQVEIVCDENKISVPKLKPKKQSIDFLFLTTVLCLCFVIFFSCSLGAYAGLIGFGTKSNPVKADSVDKLIKNASNSVVLLTDIRLNGRSIEKIGSLDGNGKTIYLDDFEFAKTLEGELKNVNFVIEGEYLLDNPNTSIIEVNEGTISNVNISINVSLSENNDESEFHASALVGINNGSIISSTVSGNVDYVGNARGNAYFSGLVSINKGVIDNCKTQNGKITSENVDLSGLVSINEGTVKNSENGFSINQIASADFGEDDSSAWNPNACGITMNNEGIIENCVNSGEIQASSLSNKKYQVLVAGMVVNNEGKIIGSKNNGSVYAESENCSMYIGGIVAFNKQKYDVTVSNFISGELENCKNNGTTNSISKGQDASEVISGGIVSVNQGKISKSVNYGKQVVSVVGATPLIGGIAGFNAPYTENSFTSYSTISDCRSDTDITVSIGKKQTFLGGLVANNQSTLQNSFSIASFNVIDNNEYENESDKPLIFSGSVVGIDNISRTITGWSSSTAYNSGYCSDTSVSTIGAFVYETSIINLEDGLNYLFTDKNEMINRLKQQGRYLE